MADALHPGPNLTPEAIAIIKQGTPKPITDNPLVAAVKPREIPAPVPTAETQVKPRAKSEPAPISPTMVSIGVKLPLELSQALLKASSQRKLSRTEPFTQKDIIAEAVHHWLQKRGFMPERG